MVEVVATRKFPYGRKHVLPGETFDATEKDAKVFLKVGWATASRPAVLDVPHGLQTMTAPAAVPDDAPKEPQGEAAPEAPARPRSYTRRDMTAEPSVGQTGLAQPSLSSPQDLPPEDKT